jgi:D-serine deaminase-like pyridoxal phosphate-dependent protein
VKLDDLDTPALLLDLEAMERNLAKMAAFFAQGPTRLRPHYKNHKSPVLARRQIDAGAIGMTCATLSEAEALVSKGITDILLSTELAGEPKIRRFVDLARLGELKAIVDNAKGAAALGVEARARGQAPQVLVNINVGQNRTGITPGEPAAELAQRARAEGLNVHGLMGYEGHLGHLPDGPDKERAYGEAMRTLMDSRSLVEARGIPVEIVSAGGTGTYRLSSRFPQITESQAGSYLLMDTNYASTCTDFDKALTVLATVISKTGEERLVVDAGLKSISGELGMPVLKSRDGLHLRKLNAEHGVIDIVGPHASLDVGDRIEIWVQYSDATVNLHDCMYGIRNGKVEEVFTLHG